MPSDVTSRHLDVTLDDRGHFLSQLLDAQNRVSMALEIIAGFVSKQKVTSESVLALEEVNKCYLQRLVLTCL